MIGHTGPDSQRASTVEAEAPQLILSLRDCGGISTMTILIAEILPRLRRLRRDCEASAMSAETLCESGLVTLRCRNNGENTVCALELGNGARDAGKKKKRHVPY